MKEVTVTTTVQRAPHVISPAVQLYQLRDDFGIWGGARSCASGGCPAVVPLTPVDQPDVWFTKGWQFHLVAINMGMPLSAVISLMGDEKSFMNGTGITSGSQRNNYLTGNVGYSKDPATDKFRSTCLSIHTGWDDGTWMYPVAMDGTREPPMKPGRPAPRTLQEIRPEDYLITPWDYPEMFVICTNVRWKIDPKRLAYGPYDHGIVRPWRQDMGDNDIYTYFPFVTTQQNVRTPLSWWTKLAPGTPLPSYYRR
jgi:hypothetical protein